MALETQDPEYSGCLNSGLRQAIMTSPSPAVSFAIRLAVRATLRPRKRKSAKSVTVDILFRLIATCRPGPFEISEAAILIVASASGRRPHSPIASLRV
ncbi:hypothetical protein D4A92_22410 (plasmid) [Rhizobium rosettiformans]|uniref:DUF982 domain-containing protein n=1 Tax=Rhizobium rosettiformans TaxID=1368430 RepID=A0ABX7F145_9HYPH|nr:hypothetical protein D4A92_22410 [Rhizobium rosettiformans]